MKAILIISIIVLTYSGTAYAYPESQMDDCVSSALSNPATKSISEKAIKNYLMYLPLLNVIRSLKKIFKVNAE